jgi:hypothetical protein
MKNMGLLGLSMAALLAGCVSVETVAPVADEVRLCTTAEIEALLKQSRDPRTYAVTVYQNEEARTVFVNANRVFPGQQAILYFVSPREVPLPLVEAKVGMGGPATAVLFDTSSRESWTGYDEIAAFGLVPLGAPGFDQMPSHVVDSLHSYLCLLPSLVLDQVRMDTVLVYARAAHGPLWPLNRASAARECRLVLGTLALQNFSHVQWDFPGRTMMLSSGEAYEPKEEDVLAVLPLLPGDGPLTVEGQIDGRQQSIILDLAGDFELAMEKPPSGLVGQASLGDLVFRQVRALTSAELGLGSPATARIGARLLADYRVTLDNRRRVVYIERPLSGDETPGPGGS